MASSVQQLQSRPCLIEAELSIPEYAKLVLFVKCTSLRNRHIPVEINVFVPTSHICRQTYDVVPIGHRVCVVVQY